MNKLFNLGSWIVLFLAFLGIVVFVYWNVYPYKVIEVNPPILPIITNRIHQGGILTYEVDYCKYMKLSAVVSRTIQDGIIYALPAIQGTRAVGCKRVNNEVRIPYGLPPGKYVMEVKYTYQVNPIRSVEYIHNTEPFEVVENE